MDKKGVEVIKQMALKKYPYENVPSFEYEARAKREGYVQGFLDGVEWFKKELL
jgi:hypothetical protein